MKGKVREEKKNKTLPFICLEMGRKGGKKRRNPLFDLQRKKKRKRKIISFTFMPT